MRLIILFAFLLSMTAANAQTFLPGGFIDYGYRGSFANHLQLNDSAANKKWSISKYSGISTSFSFFKGGNATIISAPIGLQLNRKLNNNLYAFAGVFVAPSYISINPSFANTGISKMNQNALYNTRNLGMYSRAELGLQYINDERTFSISGSIGIERSTYPMPVYMQTNNTRQNPVIGANR